MNPLRNPIPWILATLSGVLYFVGFVGFDQWYLAWVSLVPLLLALRGAQAWKQALALSWWMGFVTHLGGYFWVVHLLQSFAHLPLPLAFLGYLLLSIGQGAIFGAVGLLAWGISRRAGLSLGITVAPALVAVELTFPLLFPSYFANSQTWVPLVTQVADLGGVLLVSFVLALANGAIYELVLAALERRRPRPALPATAAVVLAATLVYGTVRIGQIEALDEAAPKLKTAIVQANVGAASKHERAGEGIRRYQRMTEEAMRIPGIGLVVWPESGLNRAVTPQVKNLEGWVARQVSAPMIVGALRAEFEGRRKIWNAALAVDEGGEILASYDKIQLLAFGEYVPGDSIFPQVYDLLPYTSRFERGQSRAPLPVGDYALSTDICYEDILPSFIRSLMGPIDEAGTRPHAMVNITNDSWYGPHEPPIHLALATFRSIEHRRWLIRSTATGISAFVDAAGRPVRTSGFETEELLVHEVPMITGGPTLYGRFGDWPGWFALAACAVGLFRRRRGETAGQQQAQGRGRAEAA
ncbi:apolipoprotein N-acyltransferase [Vulgatibacter sp.]|uniref:apolipoprotein N-acyltransferase n=1 Tax=Vulgatibacter sp. TaxID=1971226 RepID=UPI003563CB5A